MTASTVSVDNTPGASSRMLTVVEAVREALREEMERDSRVVVLGEDIGALGGVFRATDGLLQAFGSERIIDTPMMELGIAGLAVGMAMHGLRPVAEIQFADFIHAAADHIISDAAKMRFRTNGDWDCPLVIRSAYGGGLRGGPYHSQSVEAFYCHVPGLRVVAASSPADAKGLLIAAIRHPDPVLFLEHKKTYRGIKGEVPLGESVLSLDKAHVVRPGRDVTVVAWGWVLHETLAAAETLAADGLEVEVIDPRTLNPLDTETILSSVRRTGRLCVVHEDTRTMGLGAEIGCFVSEHALDDLRAPVRRLTMPDVAGIPASAPMEDFLIPDRPRIARALRQLAQVDRGQRTQVSAHQLSDTADAANGVALHRPKTWPELLVDSTTQVPQAASIVEVDMSRVLRRLEANRQTWAQRGLAPSYTPVFAEALIAALAAVPQANSSFDAAARGIRRHRTLQLGLSIAAADGSHPRHGVVKDADTRNLLGLAVEVQAIQTSGALVPDGLMEATVTLADYGANSALFAVPLVLPGQALAVRVGAVEERLLSRGRGFAVGPAVLLCASVDHRVLDGMDAGALLGKMRSFLEDYPLEPMV